MSQRLMEVTKNGNQSYFKQKQITIYTKEKIKFRGYNFSWGMQ
jgi:hypothetical protein